MSTSPSVTVDDPAHHHSRSLAEPKMFQPLQHAAYFASRFANWVLRANIQVDLNLSDLDPDSFYIVASNHQHLFDPFVICGALPFPVWRRLTPMRYFTQNGVLRSRLSRAFLFGLGCFPAYQDPYHQYGLPFGIDALNKGHSAFIFPEGRRTTERQEAKGGVSVLANLAGAKVIPAYIEWHRRSFSLRVGKPVAAGQLSPEEILDQIYALQGR